ncbi:MAG: pirin [Deltaproteobacteria bacterium]|jgi:hypothetical protein|nr:pirin [Deltaproteobacteria bacterium]
MPTVKKHIKTYLNEQEMQFIASNAAKARLSMSAYVKRICLGYEPKSAVDSQAVLELIRLKSELGRLGGLLKFSLGEKTLERSRKINDLIDALAECKAEIDSTIKAMDK